MFRFKQNQRFRVVVGVVCFYARVKEIRAGVGDLPQCNAATQKALDALEFTRAAQVQEISLPLALQASGKVLTFS